MALSFVSHPASPRATLATAKEDQPAAKTRGAREPATPEGLQQVQELKAKGLSVSAIAGKLGIKKSAVNYYLYVYSRRLPKPAAAADASGAAPDGEAPSTPAQAKKKKKKGGRT